MPERTYPNTLGNMSVKDIVKLVEEKWLWEKNAAWSDFELFRRIKIDWKISVRNFKFFGLVSSLSWHS